MNTTPPTAIILHGPPAAGKTETSTAIQRRFPNGTVRLIDLDNGWLAQPPHNFRYKGGQSRYADIRKAQEPILILELASGEPPDLKIPGATRAASEWLSVLEETGRAVFAFRLSPEWPEAADRLMERVNRVVADLIWPRDNALFLFWQFVGLYALYDHNHPLATLPATLKEKKITTSGRAVAEVADEILRVAKLV